MAETLSQAGLTEAFRRRAAAEAAQAEADRLAAEQAQLQARRTASRGFGGVAQDAGVQLLQGAVGLGQAAYGVTNLATLGLLDRGVGLSDNFRETQNILDSWKTEQTQYAQQQGRAAFDQGVGSGLAEYVTNPLLLQNLLVSNLPSLIPGAAAGRAAATAAAEYGVARGLGAEAARQLVADRAESAVLRTVGAQVGGATNVDAINQIAATGASDTQAQIGGLGAGVIAGLAAPAIARFTGAARLEAAAANALPGGAGAAGLIGNPGLIAGVAQGAVREGVEETAQSATEQLAKNLVTPGQGLWDGVGEHAALGGLAGGLLGGGMGGVTSLTSPRTSSPLRDMIEQFHDKANTDAGSPLTGSGLLEPLRANEIDLGATPVPGGSLPEVEELPTEVEEIVAAPAPLRSLYDITGRRPSVLPPASLIGVEELAAPQRPGLLGVLDAQRGRGFLGGTDLFAGPLPTEGAFPAAAPAPEAAPAQSEVAPTQGSLDFDAPEPTWKQSLARELGLKPANLRGKAWDAFVQAADQAGVTPTSPQAGDFLRQIAPQLAADPATAPVFAARLAQKYAPAPTAPVAATAPVTPAAVPPTPVAATPPVLPVPSVAPTPVQATPAFVDAMDDAAREDNAVALADMQRLVDAGTLTPEAANATVERAVRAGKIARDKAVVGDYLNEAVARAAGQPYNYASTIDLYEAPGVGDVDPRVARKTLLQREQAEVQALRDQQAAMQQAAANAAIAQPSSAVPGQGAAAPAEALGIDATIAKYQRLDPTATPAQATADAYMDLLADATNVDLLDETFIAIKNHPAWATLDSDQQDEITEEFNARYDRIEGGGAGKFQRGSVATPMNDVAFYSTALAANRNRAAGDPEVVPLESVRAYEERTGNAAPPDAKGVFDNGTIYLIRQNISDAKDLALVLAHERGHHGLGALLGDRLAPVMNRLWTNAATRSEIKSKMKAMAGNVDTADGGLRRLAAEEVLADRLASGQPVNGDILSKARAGVENFFARVLGYSDLKMTNAEIEALLRDVGKVLRGTSPSTLNEGEPEHLRGLVDLMGDPTPSAVKDPRFSRALNELDAIAAAADSEGDGTRKAVNDVAKRAGQAGLGALRRLGDTTNTGGVFATLLDATPLNQIANLYGRQFTDSAGNKLLNQFAREKRAKESDFNKTLTEERTLKYREGEGEVKTAPLQLAREWDKFRSTNPAKAEALDRVQQYSTLYRVWPDKTGGLENQSKLNYEEQSFTEAERAQALRELQRLWKSLGPEGQALYRKAQATYTNLWNRRFVALRNELSRRTGYATDSEPFKAAFGRTIDAALQRLKTGPYSPLQRYGDYMVTVRDQDGSVVWFSGHDTKAEAEKAAAEYRRTDFADPRYRVGQSSRREHNWELQGISKASVDAMENAVDTIPALAGDDKAQLRREVRAAMVEAYLQSLPQQAFLQHANLRKGVGGFTMDSLRAFSDYSQKAARNIASLQHDGLMTNQLTALQNFVTEQERSGQDVDVTKLQRVVDAVNRQHAASQNFDRSPTADLLSQGGFLWYMTSPSQLFINSMQVPMVTLPRLAGSYGNTKALGAVKTALGNYTKSGFDLLGGKSVLPEGSPERQVLDELYRRGVLDFSFSHDVAALAAGEGGEMSGHWRRFMEIASAAMHKSEVFNRQVTALAATRLEMEKRGLNGGQLTDADRSALADAAEEAVLTTQFDYSQSNKPKLLQGPWRKVIFQFQQYRLNMLAMMGKDIRDGFLAKDASPEERQSARRALAWVLGTQLALTGAAGSVLAPIAFLIADLFRDDEDLLDSRTEFVRSVPQILAHGLLSGALDMSRVGGDSLIPILGDRAYAPKDGTLQENFNYYLMRNLGPWVGLLGGAAGGVDKAFNGDVVGATKGLLPKPFADAYKALYESQAGARDARQITYYEPNLWDTVVGAAGLRSGERAQAEELRGAAYTANLREQNLTRRYLGQLAMGHALGDQEMVDRAMGSINDWNTAHPDMAIRASDLRRAIVNRVRAQQNATEFGIPSARPPSQSLRDAMGM